MKKNIVPPFLNKKFDAQTPATTNNEINEGVVEASSNEENCFFFENRIKIILQIYLVFHILLMYIYQFRFFRTQLTDDNLITRLLGLYSAITTKCEEPAHFYFQYSMKFQQVTYPFILILFYWVLKFEFAYIKDLKNSQVLHFFKIYLNLKIARVFCLRIQLN